MLRSSSNFQTKLYIDYLSEHGERTLFAGDGGSTHSRLPGSPTSPADCSNDRSAPSVQSHTEKMVLKNCLKLVSQNSLFHYFFIMNYTCNF
jgi:hypothetical protein